MDSLKQLDLWGGSHVPSSFPPINENDLPVVEGKKLTLEELWVIRMYRMMEELDCEYVSYGGLYLERESL